MNELQRHQYDFTDKVAVIDYLTKHVLMLVRCTAVGSALRKGQEAKMTCVRKQHV